MTNHGLCLICLVMKKSSEPTTEDFLSTFERIVNAAWGLTDEYEPEPRAEVWFFLDDERESPCCARIAIG